MKQETQTKILIAIWVLITVYFMIVSIGAGVLSLFLGAFLSGFMLSINISNLLWGNQNDQTKLP